MILANAFGKFGQLSRIMRSHRMDIQPQSGTTVPVSYTVTVDTNCTSKRCPVYIGRGFRNKIVSLANLRCYSSILLVSNTVVGPLHDSAVLEALRGHSANKINLVDGESSKEAKAVLAVIDEAVRCRLDRKSAIIALGGGVVGDVVGFAASIYQRGIDVIHMPSTLMAMVDSAVGGKTGVNHPIGGKNVIGTFHQPAAVVVDIDLLDTLPDREFRSGLAEVVKYGLIKDPRLFEWLEANLERVLQRDPSAVLEVVRRSCEIKAAIVSADEREGPSGVRATLNLGHTFGHAIEAGLGYGALLHGEAVAVGLVMASQLSAALGWVPPERVDRVRALLGRAHLPVSLKGACELIGGHRRISSDTFLDLMSR